MSELTNKINQHLSERVQKGELSNEDIISIIDHIGSYLNLKTISDYAKAENISYNGVLKRMGNNQIQKYTLFNQTFIIDNE